jgi:hypothetical protein
VTDVRPLAADNLDQYGSAPIAWDDVVRRLDAATAAGGALFTVLGTTRPDGRPHAAPIGALWVDRSWYVVTGPNTQKGRNLARRADCTLSVRVDGIDIVFTGTARRVTDADELAHVTAAYNAIGWPAEVVGDALTAPFTAQSAGPPPWYLHRIDAASVVAVGAGGDVMGAMRWTFA